MRLLPTGEVWLAAVEKPSVATVDAESNDANWKLFPLRGDGMRTLRRIAGEGGGGPIDAGGTLGGGGDAGPLSTGGAERATTH